MSSENAHSGNILPEGQLIYLESLMKNVEYVAQVTIQIYLEQEYVFLATHGLIKVDTGSRNVIYVQSIVEADSQHLPTVLIVRVSPAILEMLAENANLAQLVDHALGGN